MKPGDIYVCTCKYCEASGYRLIRMICTPIIEGELVYMFSRYYDDENAILAEPISLKDFETFSQRKL